VFLAYFDESGDHGLLGSPTSWFVLSCVLLRDSDWLNTLDEQVNFRRALKTNHKIKVRDELKGSAFKRGHGAFAGLTIPRADRWALYDQVLDFYTSLPVRIFSVAIHKARSHARGYEPRRAAWNFALQRVDTFCKKQPLENDRVAMIFPDAGHGVFIRRQLRALRRGNVLRGYYGGTLHIPTRRIVEDPNDRESHHSYFVQMADLCAFACHRSAYVDPKPKVPRGLWARLNSVLLTDVNSVKGGPPGIVRYPYP
jgi:hypothetical protein